MLLLDEPSNDLDVETLRALEDALLEFAGPVMVISHDRWFLDRIATHILAFEGDSQVTFFDGNYQEYEADKRTPRRGSREAEAPRATSRSAADRSARAPGAAATRGRSPRVAASGNVTIKGPLARFLSDGGLLARRLRASAPSSRSRASVVAALV